MGVPEEGESGSEGIDIEPGGAGCLHVGEAVGEGEGDLLSCGRARFADVVAADRDGVPARQLGHAVREEIGDQPHRGGNRVDVGAAGDVLLEDVVLHGAPDRCRIGTLLSGDQLVEQQQDRRCGVDRHGRGHLRQRDTREQRPHVGDGVDRDPHLPDLPFRHRIIGVQAHLGGEVERDREPRLTGLEQTPESSIGRGGVTESGVLAHGPEPTRIHRRIGTTGERVLARVAEFTLGGPSRQVGRSVDRLRFVHGCWPKRWDFL